MEKGNTTVAQQPQHQSIGTMDREQFFARLDELQEPIDDGSGKLEAEEFVAQIIKDPVNPPGVRALMGYLGPGVRDGIWRLYSSLDLDDYIEFDAADKVHAWKVPALAGATGLTRTIVWLKRDARVWHSRMQRRTLIEGFLQGDLAQRAEGAGQVVSAVFEDPLARYSSRTPC
jgi:hypothetical protein